MHVDLKSDGDWLREGHARITLGLFVRSLRILPWLAQLANYVLKWRLDSMLNYLERVNWLPEEKCLISVRPPFIERWEQEKWQEAEAIGATEVRNG